MAVVINAKGTSVAQFQIGKQGPIIKNNSGTIEFTDKTDTDLQVQILNTANAVNYLTLTGSVADSNPIIAAVGADTNIDIKFEPKGLGEVILGPTGGSTSSLQAEDDQDLVVKGGDSGGSADAGDIIVEGGDGSGAFAPGDVIIRGGSGGTGTSFITLDSGVVVGSAAGGNQGAGTINASNYYIDGVVGLSSSLKTLSTKTATYTTVLADDAILADSTSSGFTITLGTAAVSSGKQISVKDSGGNAATNNITVDTEAAETIDGSASVVLTNDYESYTFISDGTNWFINGHVFPADYGSV